MKNNLIFQKQAIKLILSEKKKKKKKKKKHGICA